MRKETGRAVSYGAPNSLLLLRTMNQLWGIKRKKEGRKEGRKREEKGNLIQLLN